MVLNAEREREREREREGGGGYLYDSFEHLKSKLPKPDLSLVLRLYVHTNSQETLAIDNFEYYVCVTFLFCFSLVVYSFLFFSLVEN